MVYISVLFVKKAVRGVERRSRENRGAEGAEGKGVEGERVSPLQWGGVWEGDHAPSP